jgi:N-acetylneuraminate synthase
MIERVQLGDRTVGAGEPALVIAEIGINHNGDLDLCQKLIIAAATAGAEVVKFQKRTVDVVYTAEELARPRESTFGTTNGDLKRGLEFNKAAYEVINDMCASVGVAWTASCWDQSSVDFVEQFSPPFYKIASASLTDDNLLERHRETGRPIVLSTGMSSLEEIDHAVEILDGSQLVLLQCTSTYPSAPEELNLRAIATLRERYGVPVGYSAHDAHLATSIAAVAFDACIVERHVTLDRGLWGSDQASSIEPDELTKLIDDIRLVEKGLGDGTKRVYPSEVAVREKLRRVG